MKIILCSDSFLPIIDGVGRVVKAYAENLAKRGNEVYVVTPSDNTGYRGNLGYEILDFTSVKMADMPWKIGINTIDSHFPERLKWINPDIVHVHTPGPAGFVGKNIAKKKHVPLVGSFHSKYYDDILKATHSKVAAKLGSSLVADFYKPCNEVWAVSDNASQTLHSYGYKKNIIIMPNGTDVRILNTDMVDDVAKQYSIDKSKHTFLFVGQINWKKNILRILESCALLKQKGFDFQLVLAGKGPDEDAIKRKAQQLGLTQNVIMTGHIHDTQVLDCVYSLADLFLFPSIYDNAPMVLREAAAMKTPAVVIENSSSAEVIQDKFNGFICKDTDQSLAQTIEEFIKLPEDKKAEIGYNASQSIPIPWDGLLINSIEERYKALCDNKTI